MPLVYRGISVSAVMIPGRQAAEFKLKVIEALRIHGAPLFFNYGSAIYNLFFNHTVKRGVYSAVFLPSGCGGVVCNRF